MPHNSSASVPVAGAETIAAEQGLIGTMFMVPQHLAAMRDVVEPEGFVDPIHQATVAAMYEMFDRGEIPSVSTVVARVGNPVLANGQTLQSYLRAVQLEGAGPVQSIPGNLRAVREASGMRTLQRIAEDLQLKLAGDGIIDPVPVAIEVLGQLDRIIAAHQAETMKAMMLGEASRAALERIAKARESGEVPGIPTGIPSLDKMLNGLRPGQLIVEAGRPAMGKTALGLKIGLHAAEQPDTAAMMASLEMSAEELAERALAAQAYRMGHEITYERASAAVDLSDEEFAMLYAAQAEIDRLPFFIEQRSDLTIQQLCASARRYFAKMRAAGKKHGLLVVDYLSLVRAGDRYKGNRVHEVGEVTRALKSLAKELGIAVLLLCQLNRAVEHRDDKHPIMADLRDSGEIEQDADTVLFVFREQYYLEQQSTDGMSQEQLTEYMERLDAAMNVLEIGVAKQRKGRTGWVRCLINLGCNAVYEQYRY